MVLPLPLGRSHRRAAAASAHWVRRRSAVAFATRSLNHDVVIFTAFLAEQRRVCGDDKEYVFPYTRKSGTVKGHCRKC